MKHVRGLARAFGYLSLTAIVFSAWSVRAAHAEIQQQTIVVGRQMMDLAHASSHAVTPITFNGQKMFLSSSVSDDPAKSILDRYEGHCKADPGQPAAGWKDVEATNTRKDLKAPAMATSGFMRTGDDAEGTVVCFVRGAEMKTSVQEAFKSFAETGELGALGKLRYVYAKKNRQGKTHVLTAWTDDRFNLVDLMGDEGKDVPGHDFPEIPRVPNSNRVISAHADGAPYGVNVYKTNDPPSKVVAFYDESMAKTGFFGTNPGLSEEKDGGLGRAYVKDGVALTVAAHRDGDATFVALGLAGVAADPTLGKRAERAR